MAETVRYKSHPSMFRNRPVGFLILVALIPAVGLGAILLIRWYIRCLGTTLTITDQRTTLRKGILSKSLTEVWHANVRNVQIDQTLGQRLFGVGRLAISSAGQSGMEIDVEGIPNPDRAKRFIDDHRNG